MLLQPIVSGLIEIQAKCYLAQLLFSLIVIQPDCDSA
jgi:hypothetical protein